MLWTFSAQFDTERGSKPRDFGNGSDWKVSASVRGRDVGLEGVRLERVIGLGFSRSRLLFICIILSANVDSTLHSN